jgi:hypothetical protein
MTLGLLVLATSLLIGISRAALTRTLEARQAEQDLQRRWGAASCRDAVLPFTEQILSAQELKERKAVPSVRLQVALGGQVFQIVAADELTKANVNSMLVDTDRSVAENRLRQALSGSGLGNRLRLRPGNAPGPQPAPHRPTSQPTGQSAHLPVKQWILGYGQVFDDVGPEALFGRITGTTVGPGELITCWGGGDLNVRRAPPEALALALSPAVSQFDIGELLKARKPTFEPPSDTISDHPRSNKDSPTVGSIIQHIRQIRAAARITHPGDAADVGLVERSTCYSLWVVVQDGRRYWYTLDILDLAEEGFPRRTSFAW